MWKSADIIPLPKKKSVSSLEKDLQSISWTPVLSEILESFVVGWMKMDNIHSSNQYEGISKHSTTDALIHLLHKIHIQLDGKQAYARILLLDFSKAFDHTGHGILLSTQSFISGKEVS